MEITQKRYEALKRIFRMRYRVDDATAHDCTVMLLEKNKWVDKGFGNVYFKTALVDVLREQYARLDSEGEPTVKGKFNIATRKHWVELDEKMVEAGSEKYMPGAIHDKTLFWEMVQIVRHRCRRDKVGCIEVNRLRNGVVVTESAQVSIRRVIFKHLLGWSQKEIGQFCGLTESRISQIIKIELNRLRLEMKLKWKKRRHPVQ